KGFDVLMRAMVELKAAYLWLAGTGPEEDALKSLADDLGLTERVRFLGWRSDVEALMRAGDVVAMPSRSEGIGTVFIEAWASGTPLVATASEGPAEFMTDGENGRLVAIDDVAALAAALGDVLGDQPAASRLAKAAKANYEQNFTSEKIAARYRQTLEAFAATGPRTGPARLSLKSIDTRSTDI
ncbi:MAG: glycosyltransferase, partial [Hyphomicrobiales bacterium]